ncbi:MAG: LPS export ABC transporter periplasmic protein LptC, partial [Deltaproteobacteria bacterium]|nr:LPS export ABC transporter periplasmic protein LptC [Deltaproteobacteria bacterium]
MRNLKQKLLLGSVATLIIVEVVMLSPSSVERESTSTLLDPNLFIITKNTIATGIPQGKIPEYSIDRFEYISTQHGDKQWNLLAKKANYYKNNNIVHAYEIKAILYNPDGKITTITGREAKYYTEKKELEIFSSVHSKFPDGFETNSDYLRYLPRIKKIEMPIQYLVKGESHESNDQDIFFTSQGLDYAMTTAEILLPKDVKFKVIKKGKSTKSSQKPEITNIFSDMCFIDRKEKLAKFRMSTDHTQEAQFVEITQEDLYIKGRIADLNYGNFSEILQNLTVYQDVYIRETKKKNLLRY